MVDSYILLFLGRAEVGYTSLEDCCKCVAGEVGGDIVPVSTERYVAL